MNYLSVCAGIEAASCAWHPLGWKPVAFSEVDAFPSAVLAHHYPSVPNLGDMTRFEEWPDVSDLDVLVGGTPCQSFSVAGLRKGMADARGNLALDFVAIAGRYRPRWIVWENVPGVLSSGDGRDLASILGGLAGVTLEPPADGWQNSGIVAGNPDAYGLAWRVLDAQYFGVAQRRRRVFVVGHLGAWQPAAAVLLESASLRGDPAPRRQSGERAAGTLTDRFGSSGANGNDAADGRLVGGGGVAPFRETADALTAAYGTKWNGNASADNGSLFVGHDVAHSLRGDGFDTSEDGTGRGTPLVPDIARCVATREGSSQDYETTTILPVEHPVVMAPAFSKRPGQQIATKQDGTSFAHTAGEPARVLAPAPSCIAFNARQDSDSEEVTHPLDTDGHSIGIGVDVYNGAVTGDVAATMGTMGSGVNGAGPTLMTGMAVRRLTPRECERLQGFPDDYTLIPYRGKPAADGPRYKALGNSMAVPVMRWIGERIELVAAAVRVQDAAA